MSDTDLLNHLERLLVACPHAVILFNDDPDVEDAQGLVPLGFSIRMDGCGGPWIATGETLRGAIEQDFEYALTKTNP